MNANTNTNSANAQTIETPAGTFIVLSRKTVEDFADDRGKQRRMERDGIDAELTLKKIGKSKKLYSCVEFGGQFSEPSEIREITAQPSWIIDDSRD